MASELFVLLRQNKEFIGIVVGFLGTVVTIRRQTRVLQTHVALDFFKRYADITDRMPDPLRLAKYKAPEPEVDANDWQKITRSMIQYGNLCSEGFALWQLGRVPKEIWEIWSAGIRER